MLDRITISLDAMGGDFGASVVVAGAAFVLNECKNIFFIFYGKKNIIMAEIAKFPELEGKYNIIHTDNVISSNEKPSISLRKGKNSSMRLAINAVKDKAADCVISAGNTGAFMVISKIVLQSLEGITRPAIASIIPAKNKNVLMMDLGANISCDALDLCGFAFMGDAFVSHVIGTKNPLIGILNIGSEDTKGHNELRNTAQILKDNKQINFYGFIEGNDILQGNVDVIITDGFSGNIALKTMEGTAKFMSSRLREAFSNSIFSKIGYLFARKSLIEMKKQLDPRIYNGAMFLGLNGIAVKSHGGADAFAFSCAIKEGYALVKHRINDNIINKLSSLTNGNEEIK